MADGYPLLLYIRPLFKLLVFVSSVTLRFSLYVPTEFTRGHEVWLVMSRRVLPVFHYALRMKDVPVAFVCSICSADRLFPIL